MDLKDIINRFEDKDDAEFKENCLVISKSIQEAKLTILDLTESLGPLLTDKHVSKQELGVLVLNEVLKNIALDALSFQQLGLLADFYNSKFKNQHQILPAALAGILILIQFENFPAEKIIFILNSIFHHVPCQQQQRADRYIIFQIFDVSFRTYKQEILSMKLEFVYGVLQSIDGERDPRNLLFLFKWMKIFLSEVSLHHLCEDMFEILACYFPVDFRAPPSENIITRETLAEALSPCLCAIPDFGDSCISLALEKLDSSLEIAKFDSLKLLKEGCSIFETSVYLEKSSDIWSLIQKEILSTSSNEIRLECLVTLSTFISKISEDENEEYLNTLQNILDTLKGNLLPDSKVFERSAQILVYTAAGSEKSCKYIIKEIVPILTNIYNMTAYNDQRSTIVKTLVEFAKVYFKYNKNLNNDEVPELLKIPLLCLELLNVPGNFRKIGFDCLVVLVPYLSIEIRQKLYMNIQASIFIPDEQEIRKSFLQCLKTTASYYPDEVKTHVFNNITPQLTSLNLLLKSLTILINLKEFRNYILESYLHAIRNADFFKIAVQNLRCLVENEEKNNGLLKELIDKNVLDTIIELIFNTNCIEIDIFKDISIILKLIIAPQTFSTQKEILQKYLQTNLEKIQTCELNLLILYGLLAPLRREITLDSKLLDFCYQLSLNSNNEVVIMFAVQLLANLVNKMTDDENLLQFLDKTNKECSASVLLSPKRIITASWITKALLMRNHRQGIKWLDWLIQLLELYPEVAEGLKVVMNDDYDALSLYIHCQKSFLYRQKTFVYITNKICEKYDESKPNYLRTLGYILEFTPQQAILLQFPKICRFIILCLEKNKEPEVLSVLLKVVRTICSSNSALLETHLEDFITRILKLTSFKGSMKIRIDSLRCLVAFTTSYPVYKLLLFKSMVLHQLGICVDDKKRLVRKEAMEARSLWFLLDAPV